MKRAIGNPKDINDVLEMQLVMVIDGSILGVSSPGPLRRNSQVSAFICQHLNLLWGEAHPEPILKTLLRFVQRGPIIVGDEMI